MFWRVFDWVSDLCIQHGFQVVPMFDLVFYG